MSAATLRPPLASRVRHALEAFTDLLPPSEEYSYELEAEGETPVG